MTQVTQAKQFKKTRAAIEKKNTVLQQLKIEYVAADSIHPNSYNPNRQSAHDFELLVHSMHEDGFTQPIICQMNRDIVDGEHRWTGAIVLDYLLRSSLKLTPENIEDARKRRAEIIHPDLLIPTVFVDMTPEQMRISTLRHNRARGSEDYELTAQLFADLRELGALDWAADSLMLDEVDINHLLQDLPAPEVLAGEEYSQGWEPDEFHKLAVDQTSTEMRVIEGRDSRAGILTGEAMTTQAIEQIQERERALKLAKTEQERVMVQKDSKFFRLNLIFAGDEAELVREGLGDAPAETIVLWCRNRSLDSLQ